MPHLRTPTPTLLLPIYNLPSSTTPITHSLLIAIKASTLQSPLQFLKFTLELSYAGLSPSILNAVFNFTKTNLKRGADEEMGKDSSK